MQFSKNLFVNIILLLVIFVLTNQSCAFDMGVPSSFEKYVPIVLGAGYESGTVYLAPELIKFAEKERMNGSDSLISISVAIKGEKIVIAFDPGPSEDPTFIVDANGKGEGAIISGSVLYVSSAGNMYSKTMSNEYFEKTRKYKFSSGKIIEVKQPFYYIGKECETSSTMVMYTQKCNKGTAVAVLPKNTITRIVLADFEENSCNEQSDLSGSLGDPVMQFLVVTPFGLSGWVSSSGGYLNRPGKPLSCIRYYGD